MPRFPLATAAGPTVWFAGDVREPSFATLLGALAARTRLQVWPNARAIAQATAGVDVDRLVIVVGTSRGGPLDAATLEQLRERHTASQGLLFVAPWSAGVLAKQKLPAGIERIEWHERERLWSLLDTTPTHQPAASPSRLVLLADFNAAEAEVVLDLCAARGLHALRSTERRTRTTEIHAVLWRTKAWDQSAEARWNDLRAEHPAAVLLALVESLRPGEARDLLAHGCSAVLSWPCQLAPLERSLDALLGRAPESPAAERAA